MKTGLNRVLSLSFKDQIISNKMKRKSTFWAICTECEGEGKKKRRIKKSVRLRYQTKLDAFEKNKDQAIAPVRPEAAHYTCLKCAGSGLITSESFLVPSHENLPHIAIIGGGIGGVALAVACLHRGIPYTLYERDKAFDTRSQGYGLTLQQASKAIEGFGVFNLKNGVVSTRHLVHTPDGKIIAEWGMRKWLKTKTKSTLKKTNIHIARQSLRLALLEQLPEYNGIQWGHQLTDFKETTEGKMNLHFQVSGEMKTAKADLVVGADGIRSVVRNLLIGESALPLRYLDCIVILGICPLKALKDVESSLLDSATVFQTANGNERIYIMPYDASSVMWQLSFPMSEKEAKDLSAKGPEALKEEACRRTKWHTPIPQILAATLPGQISGYPVYDRALLTPELLEKAGAVTLIGDAAHPMSPFKGQGANQALLDALRLARAVLKGSKRKDIGIRKSVLNGFESEMLQRSAIKVEDSAAAAQFLHSEIALYEGDEPRGRIFKRNDQL